ncbi:trans-membrane golgi-localized RING-finger ubiquitin ligase [Trichoderma austrokoningii]
MPQANQPHTWKFFFVFFIIWLILPDTEYQSQSIALSDLILSRLSDYRAALDVLNATQWGDFVPPEADRTEDNDASPPKYINLTGFREEDHLSWQYLNKFRERGLELSHRAMSTVGGNELWDVAEGEPIWANASGVLGGQWVRHPELSPRTPESYNLSQSVPSMHWLVDDRDWARNVTGTTGRIHLRLEGNRTVTGYEQLSKTDAPLGGGLMRGMKGVLTIEDDDISLESRLWGVHWPRQGVIIMATTSEKFDGIFGLPHLTPGPDYFQSSQRLLNQSLARTIAMKQKNIFIDQNIPWNADAENPLHTPNPSPNCEYIMYAQIHPPSRQSLGLGDTASKGEDVADIIRSIESELEFPLGVPIQRIPDLHMSSVIYSPDCSFMLETKGPPDFPPSEADHLVGVKSEVQVTRINKWLIAYAALIFFQVMLLKDQMRETYTPSTLGRVSFWTISAMGIVDCMTFCAAATWVSTAQSTFLPTLTLMFSSLMSMMIGGSLLARIHEVQVPQTRAARREGAAGSNSGQASSTASAPLTPNVTGTGPILPGPVTAGRGPEPAAATNVADGAPAATTARPPPPLPPVQTFQSIVGRYLLLVLFISFVGISSLSWYAPLRSLFINICVFVYLSMWVPQIYRNVNRNCRRALKWKFVVGQSILRLAPLAYFWLDVDNFLFARTDPHAFLVICLWVWLQIFVLATQDIVGPRFCVPKDWTPDAWDYHPVLREDNVEAGALPIGLNPEDSPSSHDHGRSSEERDKLRPGGGVTRTIDCAICRELLEVPIVRAGEEDMSVTGVFARRMYMVTPCRHIFHTACLENWMKFRLQCPICREDLPPL